MSKCTLGVTFALLMLAAHDSAQAKFKVLHAFSGGTDGCYPVGGLIRDGAGNLYGTTAGGTCNSCGTVFEIPRGSSETVLYTFTCGADGEGPNDTLLMDKKGNLYGGTVLGGSIGCGVIFKVTPGGNETTFHDFAGSPSDGCVAQGTLIMDGNGNIFGTTSAGGKYDGGTVFELSAKGIETVLYSFCRRDHCPDGELPVGGLYMDAATNLYGTTQSGGTPGCGNECGTVFKLEAGGKETVLYAFKGPPGDGNGPDDTPIEDGSGNFYGTLFNGGHKGCYTDEGCGAVFALAPDGRESVLHFFTGKRGDGANPVAGGIRDAAGNLYGATQYGGGRDCELIRELGCGTVFELAPDGSETVLYAFGKGTKGAYPVGGLVADKAGHLYGTASEGGAHGFGSVFKITP